MKVAIHFASLGPYHLSRLESALEVLAQKGWGVVSLETAGSDATYGWDQADSKECNFQRKTVFTRGVYGKIPAWELKIRTFQALDEIQPDAIAMAGWGTADARACLAWCKRNGKKAIVMSETRAADGRRVWWREWVKSWLVRKFDGALCGGESHRRYLEVLGMPREKIEFGYNVVDNRFFGGIRNAEFGMRNRESVGLGAAGVGAVAEPYFLASNRFVERKNLGRLLEAYAGYVKSFQGSDFSFQQSRSGVWPLVLLGDGELRKKLEDRCEELGLRTARKFSHRGTEDTEGEHLKLNSYKLKTPPGVGLVIFAGFRQIGELPGFYAGAGAFVHPALEEPWGLVINEAMASGLPVLSSRNVGAAEELVVEGKTGFLFDPMDVGGITHALKMVASMPPEQRIEIGRNARDTVERKVPKRAFGEGLAKLLTTN
jgi:glycosyltransferase involved in cell wall biosynthesis